ncbi:hypothetical protein [Embleya sp. NPDC001921]
MHEAPLLEVGHHDACGAFADRGADRASGLMQQAAGQLAVRQGQSPSMSV